MKKPRTVLFSLVFLAAAGCGDDVDASVDGGAGPGDDAGPIAVEDASVPDASTPASCDAQEVSCQDQSVLSLAFLETPAGTGVVTEEGTTAGEFLTHVDATGAPTTGTAPTTAYVYARFTETGLEQVTLGDSGSFESTDWDIALRRYVIRLNSGVSGPSCVLGARVPPTADGTEPTFESVTTVPGDLELYEEEYFTEADGACTLISDGSGLPGAPDSVLAGYWSYAGCLAMTGHVYIVQLRNGRHVKLQVVSYYTPSVQETCNTSGTTTSPSGAANFRLRWAFID